MRKSCKLIVLLAPMLSFWSCGNDMVKFKFVSCDYFNDKWIYDEDYPKGYDERLMEMLDIHDEKYITRSLYNDPDTLMNYCNRIMPLERMGDCQVKSLPMVKFKFVSRDYANDKWVYDEDYPKEYDERLMRSLDFHNEKYLYKDGVLYIPKELYDYPGLLMNYCNEAASSMWADYGANLGKEAVGEE